ncbi:TraR/DksA C4-type zinc finger protein [Sulfitobacter sp. D35]|uniref:TraR/DksA family transcriptional regulator n=1 Tax=Sulfitobacter sp. D35 TaxID=3083252 RepID=UPI00296FC77A|nr:TraR/DksA C4-type zinc finger protein [Sulfitobacter sp. D35]MDW4499296.1 TraR/DksA C4-type zinc finger protein [Sulfitobacter sp. D35]
MQENVPTSDRDSYRARLMAERAELLAASEETAGARRPVELDQQSVGRLSRMDAMQNQAMAKGAEARRAARLRLIESALARLGTEDFGFCDDCGEEIEARRLDLDPALLRCLSCAR